MLRCNIVSLSDGPVCKACGCANPNLFGGRSDCQTYPEPYVKPYPWPIGAVVWVGMGIFGIAFWYGVFKLIVWAITLPVVYESYSTGACVRVDDPEGVYSCENMPTKFYHEWAE